MGSKNFWIGFAAGVATIWAVKNLPVVSPIANPLLVKVGL